jgi:NAD(P)-dependent dehydrogenase (short-subunit alcohol dehydrogenase family)
MGRVQDKVAIVTGGALGIGLSSCRLLAREGAQVAITDIRDADGKRTADDINSSGGSARFWHLDVSREDEVREVLRQDGSSRPLPHSTPLNVFGPKWMKNVRSSRIQAV